MLTLKRLWCVLFGHRYGWEHVCQHDCNGETTSIFISRPHRGEGDGEVSGNSTDKCGAVFILANGESVSPCHLPAGHGDRHEGYCLGSRATWTSDLHEDSEEEQAHTPKEPPHAP